jgi:Ca2+-transporting ATPase
MTTLHESRDGQRVLYIKGAAERILARTDGGDVDAAAWQQRADDLAGRGRRVLALAIRDWDGDALPDNPEDAEKSLQLLGLVGIVDPVRPEAGDAIAECRSAGIRPVMITGDHVGTARSIAADLQLASPDDEALTGTELERLSDEELARRAPRIAVYARVSPEHKLRIVRAHQSHGSVVAMTGDGVNDAPALKQADIGVAMGVTGTDVAKEAGAMVLADDNFATIVAAVEEGRVVYDNIRKFVAYLLTTNTGEVLVLFVTILLGLPLPLLPVHLLWINLVTDGLPALALGFEPAEPDVMRRRPRKREESLFADGLAWGIVLLGVLMAASCVGLFWWYVRGGDVSDAAAQAHSLAYAQTLVFLTLSMFQLFHVLAIRSASVSFFRQGPWSNWRLTIAVLLGTGLQIAVTYVPPLQRFFHTVPLSALDLAIGVAVASSVFWVLEGWKLVRPRFMAAGR